MNQTNISSTSDKHSFYKVSVSILLGFALLSIITNGYFLLSCRWIRKQFSVNLRLTVSLAAVDTWISVLFSISFILNSYFPHVLDKPLPHLNCLRLFIESLRLGAVETSILHILFLSINQLIAILFPLHHKTRVSPRFCKVCLVSLWILPMIIANTYFLFVPNQGYRAEKCVSLMLIQRRFRITVFSMMFVPLILTLLFNLAIFSRLRHVSTFTIS